MIAATSMTDLPQQIVKDLQISIIPCIVITNEGRFYDNVDMDSEELVRYMADRTKMVDSEPPTEEELTAFFSQELKKAHHLIFITLTTSSSREYERAIRVAKLFENVTIVNSETLSSATGILVMIAARLAGQGMPVDRIVEELEEAKKFIRTSFVIKNTDVMARRGRISPFMNSVLNTLWLRPVLRMKDDKLGVGRFMFGSEERCYEKYIEHALPSNAGADTSFIFVTYAGMTEEQLLWIEEKLSKRIKFDHIIFQKASAGISSNCGEGTFGLLYLVSGNRNYHLGSFFADNVEEEYEFDYDVDVQSDDENEDVADDIESETGGSIIEEPAQEETPKEWYETIPDMDVSAAIKNSGSKEAFLSVLQIYYDSYEAKSGEIQGFYDSQDWENYTIKVHALKSSSRLVGALKLGDDAEALEMAGKKADLEFITAHHDSLMEEYKNIHDELAPMLGASDDRPDIDPDMLADAYGGLLEFTEARDYELAKMVMDSVKEFKLPDADEERFTRLQTYLSQMDWDKMLEVLKEE